LKRGTKSAAGCQEKLCLVWGKPGEPQNTYSKSKLKRKRGSKNAGNPKFITPQVFDWKDRWER